MNNELLHDALVLGVDSDTVQKKCIAEGNKLILHKAREIARTEEVTKMQLAAMKNYHQVNLLDKKDFSKGKTQSKKKKLERGKEVTKGKNLNRLSNLNPGVGDVMVHLIITSRKVQQSIQSALTVIKLDTTNCVLQNETLRSKCTPW